MTNCIIRSGDASVHISGVVAQWATWRSPLISNRGISHKASAISFEIKRASFIFTHV
ncbi:hypothetical protein [Nostoc sp. NMS4]|uniref:hypothetical protein n=1 Tax=Nostoc sp. NMS4 TaxID=2815390 RepID=UPI0025EA248D|nr:hypothetical protein [Nostoc sp. NMS4]MBN3923529.1 hypothetical protein [Nostoc sp. NMS4]